MILIEGLPGTGKSSLAIKIAESLKSKGREVTLHLETEKNSPFRFNEGTTLDTNFDEFSTSVLSMWKSYLKSNQDSDKIVIQESLTIQQQMNFSILTGNFIKAKDLIFKIFSLLGNDTKLIYLYSSSPETLFKKTMEKRGTEWVNEVVKPIIHSPWAVEKKLTHPDAAFALIREISKNTEYILEKFPYEILRINVDSPNWDQMVNDCIDFIESEPNETSTHNCV